MSPNSELPGQQAPVKPSTCEDQRPSARAPLRRGGVRRAGRSHPGDRITWQAEKSAQTREKLLEGTLDSLADLGYYGTTISTIVDYAGVSRGSIRHHFRSKADVIAATLEHLNEKRLEAYRNDLFRQADDVDPLDYVIEAFWKHLTEREFAAHQELVVASRTNPKLHSVLQPALIRLEERWMALTLERFPHWGKLGDSLLLVSAVGGLLLEGMAYRRIAGLVSPELVSGVLAYLKDRLRRLFEGEEPVDRGAREVAPHA